MSILGWGIGIVVGTVVGLATQNPGLGLSVGIATASALGGFGVPESADQGVQREMVMDSHADIPVVYGRAIVAPKLAYVTEKTELVNGERISKLYFVGVLTEGAPAPAAR